MTARNSERHAALSAEPAPSPLLSRRRTASGGRERSGGRFISVHCTDPADDVRGLHLQLDGVELDGAGRADDVDPYGQRGRESGRLQVRSQLDVVVSRHHIGGQAMLLTRSRRPVHAMGLVRVGGGGGHRGGGGGEGAAGGVEAAGQRLQLRLRLRCCERQLSHEWMSSSVH